jgi:hypothetical protein
MPFMVCALAAGVSCAGGHKSMCAHITQTFFFLMQLHKRTTGKEDSTPPPLSGSCVLRKRREVGRAGFKAADRSCARNNCCMMRFAMTAAFALLCAASSSTSVWAWVAPTAAAPATAAARHTSFAAATSSRGGGALLGRGCASTAQAAAGLGAGVEQAEAEGKQQQWDLELFSPAKINLFLRIMGKRPDGYHDLASLFQVNLYMHMQHRDCCLQRLLACFATCARYVDRSSDDARRARSPSTRALRLMASLMTLVKCTAQYVRPWVRPSAADTTCMQRGALLNRTQSHGIALARAPRLTAPPPRLHHHRMRWHRRWRSATPSTLRGWTRAPVRTRSRVQRPMCRPTNPTWSCARCGCFAPRRDRASTLG